MLRINFVIFRLLYRSSSITASNGKDSWLKVLKNLITKSDPALKEFPLDWLNRGMHF
jgi:hypothetical protein